MTPWLRFWDWLRWSLPWWIVGAAIVVLILGSNWGTWRVAKLWFRHKIKDFLPETARQEIEHRDRLIKERDERIEMQQEEIGCHRAAIRGAMASLSGLVATENSTDIRIRRPK